MNVINEFRICFHDLESEFQVGDGQMLPIGVATKVPSNKKMPVFTLLTWEQVLNADQPEASDHDKLQVYNLQQLSIPDLARPREGLQTFSGCFHFNGRPPVRALQRGLDRMIREQESLRTHFTETESRLIRKVLPPERSELSVFDLRFLSGKNQKKQLRLLFTRLNGMPFSTETGPFVRGAVCFTDSQSYQIHLTLHQSLTERWSMDGLMAEWLKTSGDLG